MDDLTEAGFVAYNGSTTATLPGTAGSLTTKVFNYDLGETLRTRLRAPGGYNLPTTLPAVSFGNPGIQPIGIANYVSTAGGTTVVGPLWPFASDCSLAPPGLDLTDGASRGRRVAGGQDAVAQEMSPVVRMRAGTAGKPNHRGRGGHTWAQWKPSVNL